MQQIIDYGIYVTTIRSYIHQDAVYLAIHSLATTTTGVIFGGKCAGIGFYKWKLPVKNRCAMRDIHHVNDDVGTFMIMITWDVYDIKS